MVIGLASAITVGAVATHPVDRIRVVEVEAAMVPAARLFAEYNGNVLDDPRLELSINDARNELEFSPRDYDVIISEPSNPWMTVASNLFTEDFFRMARTRLRPGGVFSQWIQNYYLPAEDLRSIVAAFRASFRHVMLFETYDGVDLLLMGSQEPLMVDLDELAGRMSELSVRMDMARVSIRDPLDVLTLFRMGPRAVDRFVESAPRNTDDNARVEFSAPKTLGVYTLDENLALLREFTTDPLEVVTPAVTDGEERSRRHLELAEKWVFRGDYDLAHQCAGRVTAEPYRARAHELMARIDELGGEL
jgi:spermidine synthase